MTYGAAIGARAMQMDRACSLRVVVVGAVALAMPLSAQVQVQRVTTSVVWESYKPKSGLGFTGVRELTRPTTLQLGLPWSSTLVVAAGYARVEVDGIGPIDKPDGTLTGLLDVEARLMVPLLRDRLTLLVGGAVPSGKASIPAENAAILGPLANDVIGFAATTFGAGGNVSLGFAGALSAGSLAFGYGASYQQPFSYVPVLGTEEKFRPGGEARLRLGLEGPVARRTYVRIAGVFSARQKDEFGAAPAAGIGNRVAAYFSFEQGIGSVNVTAYAFDVFRGEPRLESTAVGAALLPKGNLLASGAFLSIPVSAVITLVPRAEYRRSASDVDPGGANEKLGSTLRFGGDVRVRLSQSTAFVLQGDRLAGEAYAGLTPVDISGYRAAAHLEWRR